MPRARRQPGPARTPLEQFGRELRHHREAKGLSIGELAELVGRNRRTITGAEDGRDCPSEPVIHRLEAILDSRGLLLSFYEAVLATRRRNRLNSQHLVTGLAPAASLDDASEFIAETVPDGSFYGPGERFEKIWTIQNHGGCEWRDRHLTRIGIAAGPGLITTPEKVLLPLVAPGDTIVVSVPCVAQFVQGTSLAAFKMTDREGRLFFPYSRYSVGLQVQVTVVDRNL